MRADQGASDARLGKLLDKVNLPTLPAVAQKLVELCKDDMAAFSDFARVIESDPGLASRILQVTNSAYYGLRNKVTTLERAIGVLGLKYVKMTSLGFRLATAVSQFGSGGFEMEEFWQQSLLRGVIARLMARGYCPGRTEEAFLVGLLQDCGIPVLVEAWGEEYVELWKGTEGSQASLYRLEREMFESDHVAVTAALTERWSLPELLAEPLTRHHRRGPLREGRNEKEKLGQIAYFVGTLSLNEPNSLSEEDFGLPEYCEAVFGCDEEAIRRVLRESQSEFEKVAQLYREVLPERLEAGKLVGQAQALLSGLTMDAVHNIFVLEEEVKRLRSRCAGLASSMNEYARQAETDDLTGLSVRQPLDRYLDNASWRVKNGETTLAVMFLDIDDFKDINNTHSHAAGDRLLQDLAMLLRGLFGESGCVARYGGDEFVVALMGLQLKQAVQLARGLVEKIRKLNVRVRLDDDRPGAFHFSCSVGMLFCEAGAIPGGSTRVMELADNQMYTVKHEGKDDMRFQVIGPSEQTPQVRQHADSAEAIMDP